MICFSVSISNRVRIYVCCTLCEFTVFCLPGPVHTKTRFRRFHVYERQMALCLLRDPVPLPSTFPRFPILRICYLLGVTAAMGFALSITMEKSQKMKKQKHKRTHNHQKMKYTDTEPSLIYRPLFVAWFIRFSPEIVSGCYKSGRWTQCTWILFQTMFRTA